MRRLLISLLALAALALPVAAQTAAPALDPANTAILELKNGKVTIQLRPDLAPQHVARVKQLMKEGFYNGQKFHRVIPEFMAQTGDPTGTGAGGSKYPDLKAEFSATEQYRRGTIGAARTSSPDSANSQFFICFSDFGCDTLQGKYTIWGKVVLGMQWVDAITPGQPPSTPDTIIRMYLASDGPSAVPAKK